MLWGGWIHCGEEDESLLKGKTVMLAMQVFLNFLADFIVTQFYFMQLSGFISNLHNVHPTFVFTYVHVFLFSLSILLVMEAFQMVCL